MRTLTEPPRGCGYRKDGGCYLMGEVSSMGALPSCVEIDPPIPLDTDTIPFTRGVYTVNFDMVMTENDQRKWLVGSSAESLRRRDDAAWEIDRYGMRLNTRLRAGICEGMSPAEAEERLAELACARHDLATYVLSINRSGRGRRIARETAIMQDAIRNKDWVALLASCWRLSAYDSDSVRRDLKRIMASIGAVSDAAII